jgi:hypothetical protein
VAEEVEKQRRRYVRSSLYIRGRNGLKARDKWTSRLANRLFVTMPWLTDADRPAVRRWAQLEYLAEQLYLELREHGVLTPEREPRRLLDDFRKMAAVQLSYSTALGMVPSARRSLADLAGEAATLDGLFATETPQDAPDASESASGPENTAGEGAALARGGLNGDGKRD